MGTLARNGLIFYITAIETITNFCPTEKAASFVKIVFLILEAIFVHLMDTTSFHLLQI